MHEEKKSPGDPLRIPAPVWNDLMECLADWKARQQNGRGGRENLADDNTVILVKNTSGEARARFDILGLDGVIFTPEDNEDSFKNGPVFKGVSPSTDDHADGKWCILLEPVSDDGIARACIAGAVCVLLDVQDDGDQWADIVDDEATKLQSGGTGPARILYKEEGTGEKWGIVRLGSSAPSGPLFGKTDEAKVTSNYNSSGVTVSIWEYSNSPISGGWGWHDTGDNIEGVCGNPFHTFIPVPKDLLVKLEYSAAAERWEIAEVPEIDGCIEGANLQPNGSGTFRPDSTTYNGETAPSGTITVWAPYVLTSGTIGAGKKITVRWKHWKRRWEVVAKEC